MPRLNVYLPDDVYDLASRWRDRSNLSEICARAIRDELNAAEGNRSLGSFLAPFRAPTLLEAELRETFALQDVAIADFADDPSRDRDAIGREAASYLDRNLSDGSLLGLAGGRQMWSVVRNLSPRRLNLKIAALGLHRADPVLLHVHPNTLVTLLWLLYSPRSEAHTIGSSPNQYWTDLLPEREHPTYFVVSSCSPFDQSASFARLLGEETTKHLKQRRVSGDYAYVFLDSDGSEITIPPMRDEFKLSASYLQTLSARRDARTLLVAGGIEKLEIMKNALSAKLCNTLITDERTARSLLQ